MKTNEQIAEEGLGVFSRVMKSTAEKLGVEYKETDKDEEQIVFSLGGFEFTLTWGEEPCQRIGGEDYRVNYQLSIWYTTPGTRFSPPEAVDTLLCEFTSIWPCVSKAFETVYVEWIKQAQEAVGCEMQEEERKEIES